MISSHCLNANLSGLGFGAMRLPLMPDGKTVDEAQVFEMTDYAIAGGITYFDTAYPYHGGQSEIVLGRALGRHPRSSYCLATKYPGHQIASAYDPAQVFQDQLRKCGVEYFDFYLLHNVYEHSEKTYLDPAWGIVDYFREQQRQGTIRHLGFSSHGSAAFLERFLDRVDCMEFCQIQLNYLDWTLQDGAAKYELLTRRGMPIIVMEPVRGGRLARLSEQDEAVLRSFRPDESPAAWCFRFLQDLPGVRVTLSGMSSMAQMVENVETYRARQPLSKPELDALLGIAAGMVDRVPCTGCRYCLSECPMGLDIPMLLSVYDELCFASQVTTTMLVEGLPATKQPAACAWCGACTRICPQGIDVPVLMEKLAEKLATLPTWAQICKQREAERLANSQ